MLISRGGLHVAGRQLWDTKMVLHQIKPMVGAATTLISFSKWWNALVPSVLF